jgi:uncharacterized protein (DUF58 family)
VEKYIPSSKGREHVLYMMRELLVFEPKSKKTDLVKALQYLNKIAKHKSIVFILSDFADDGYQSALRIAAKKHDVIGIQVYDRRDAQLPAIGLLEAEDFETGNVMWLDTNNPKTRLVYHNQFLRITEDAKNIFATVGADLVQIATGADFVKALQHFFIKRA